MTLEKHPVNELKACPENDNGWPNDAQNSTRGRWHLHGWGIERLRVGLVATMHGVCIMERPEHDGAPPTPVSHVP